MGFLSSIFGEAPKFDAAGTAKTQYEYNKKALEDSLRAGAIGQTTPFGGVSYEFDENGLPTGQNVTLSPEMQQYYSQLFQQAGQAGGATSDILDIIRGGVDISGIPDTSQLAKTAYERQVGLMQPQFEEAENQMAVNLANRGIPMGSEIWNTEMDRYQRQKESSLAGAAQQADLTATTEQQRHIDNLMKQYGINVSTLGAVNSTAPNLTSMTPQSIQTPWMQAAAPNYSQLAGQQYQGEQQAYQNKMSGLGSLFGSVVSLFSDKDMKEDREPADGEYILMGFSELPVDRYRYKDEAREEFGLPERRVGPMAQDYARVFPEGSDGHMIDMGDMVGKLIAAVKALDARTGDMAPGRGKLRTARSA